ncbi:unnamed protein product [Moneuplotes crassus]|uniref:Uncharacterized protein n=1 Tax=Euplotes crassus TaxID=5936 RepID=A0AAD1U8P0_EUPCR|nr:unnamed protein product [Moneuplotes crassus]
MEKLKGKAKYKPGLQPFCGARIKRKIFTHEDYAPGQAETDEIAKDFDNLYEWNSKEVGDSVENKRGNPNVFAYNISAQKSQPLHNPDYYNTGGRSSQGLGEKRLKRQHKDFNLGQGLEQSIKNLRKNHHKMPADFEFSPDDQDFNKVNKFDDLDLDLDENSAEIEEDFRNLDKLDSSKHERNNSLNLGSVYSKNEYQFDDKVSSVQRDLSIDNYSNESGTDNENDRYKSLINSSDMSNSENDDRIAQLGEYRQNGLMRDKTSGNLNSLSNGMMRIKSSTKLFTIHSPKEQSHNSSDSFSQLSTGDSAYPVEAFKQRAVKEFHRKISIYDMNHESKGLRNWGPRVPKHTKLTYEPPIGSKVVYSPPNQDSSRGQNFIKKTRPKVTNYHQSKDSVVSDCSENITADEGFAITFPKESPIQGSRINYLPVNKPFNRKEYIKPQSMLNPASRYSYLQVRKNRPELYSRVN